MHVFLLYIGCCIIYLPSFCGAKMRERFRYLRNTVFFFLCGLFICVREWNLKGRERKNIKKEKKKKTSLRFLPVGLLLPCLVTIRPDTFILTLLTNSAKTSKLLKFFKMAMKFKAEGKNGGYRVKRRNKRKTLGNRIYFVELVSPFYSNYIIGNYRPYWYFGCISFS